MCVHVFVTMLYTSTVSSQNSQNWLLVSPTAISTPTLGLYVQSIALGELIDGIMFVFYMRHNGICEKLFYQHYLQK